jgi:RNA polymerase sigma factor (sigma-70 family)
MAESAGVPTLVQACRNGDTGSWEALVTKYERLVFSIPLNYGLSRDDAADITQLTFTILLQSLDKINDHEHLGAWLATVARRHTWRVRQRNHRESVGEYEDLPEPVISPDTSSADTMERWETVEWLHGGLAQLNERCRELLIALYFDEQQTAYTEVAHRLGIPVGSIGPTRARCLERLKHILGER